MDLSVGTPVDPVPELIQQRARRRRGQPRLSDGVGHRRAAGRAHRLGASAGSARVGVTHRNVLPVVGSKELVAWLPTQLGLGPGDKVAYPRLAYPTYEVGARLARAEPVVYDDPTELDPAGLQPAVAQLARPTPPAGCWPRTS